MLVRVNFGWKAGKIQDIEPSAARLMLADGRASAVSFDDSAPSELRGIEAPQTETSGTKAAKAATKKR